MSWFGQWNLMDPASPVQKEMLLFHDHAIILLIGIFVLVSVMGLKLVINKFPSRNMYEAQTLEIIWTVLPAFLLIWLALPSLRLLYMLDESPSGGITMKAIGHQWYWSYEIPSLGLLSFDSYMVKTTDLEVGMYRLLEVDNHPSLPLNLSTNIITTSSDVIHAFALPSMGVKMDSVPGRLNAMAMTPMITGVFYGQCSEICGANHSFMPIVVEVVKTEDL